MAKNLFVRAVLQTTWCLKLWIWYWQVFEPVSLKVMANKWTPSLVHLYKGLVHLYKGLGLFIYIRDTLTH